MLAQHRRSFFGKKKFGPRNPKSTILYHFAYSFFWVKNSHKSSEIDFWSSKTIRTTETNLVLYLLWFLKSFRSSGIQNRPNWAILSPYTIHIRFSTSGQKTRKSTYGAENCTKRFLTFHITNASTICSYKKCLVFELQSIFCKRIRFLTKFDHCVHFSTNRPKFATLRPYNFPAKENQTKSFGGSS